MHIYFFYVFTGVNFVMTLLLATALFYPIRRVNYEIKKLREFKHSIGNQVHRNLLQSEYNEKEVERIKVLIDLFHGSSKALPQIQVGKGGTVIAGANNKIDQRSGVRTKKVKRS